MTNAQLLPIGHGKNISRDEMNLAEFPLTVLSTRSNPNEKTMEFQDTVVVKDESTQLNHTIQRKWVITGADKFGLPTSSDDEVLLGLLKLTVDDNFQNRKVYFTRYELLRVLRWTTEGRSYTRLVNALDRLSGVRVKATNAFYDRKARAHSTKNFGIIESYEINDGRSSDLKPSFFIWSEEIFKSFKDGYVKRIDLGFYLDLQSAVSKRLYRFLDKNFYYRGVLRWNLFTLAHEKVGISRNYKYASMIRQQLDPAIDELIKCGYLSKCEYEGKGKNTEIILYSAAGPRRTLGMHQQSEENTSTEEDTALFDGAATDLIQKLIQRGIKEDQAQKLIRAKKVEDYARIGKIIHFFDKLIKEKSPHVSKSPAGFLFKAIENSSNFSLPEDLDEARAAKKRKESEAAAKKEQTKKDLEKSYYQVRSREIERLKQETDPKLIASYRSELERTLASMRGTISEEKFNETVEYGIGERLASQYNLPKFEEWLSQNA